MKTCCLCGVTEERIAADEELIEVYSATKTPWLSSVDYDKATYIVTDICPVCADDYNSDWGKIKAAMEELKKSEREEFGIRVLTEYVEKAYTEIESLLEEFLCVECMPSYINQRIKQIVETTILRRTK
jgi:hypothetical protein